MKKLSIIIVSALITTLMFSCIGFSAPSKKITNSDSVLAITTKLSNSKQFSIWKTKKISDPRDLYNSEGSLVASLFTVDGKKGILGYLIFDKNGTLLEYALGESPYDSILDSYLNENSSLKTKKIKLIYDGPSCYGIETSDEKNKEFKNFLEKQIQTQSINTLKSVNEELNLSKAVGKLPVVRKVASVTQKILPNISYQEVNHGCGATAGYILTRFWDNNGYGNLISNQTIQQVIDELFVKMGSIVISETDKTYATLPAMYRSGLAAYFQKRYSGFTVTDYSWYQGSPTFSYSTLTAEINAGRPGTLLYMNNPKYGNHYVTFTGYSYGDTDGQRIYVIHDSWVQTNVFRNWDSDLSKITDLYKVKRN